VTPSNLCSPAPKVSRSRRLPERECYPPGFAPTRASAELPSPLPKFRSDAPSPPLGSPLGRDFPAEAGPAPSPDAHRAPRKGGLFRLRPRSPGREVASEDGARTNDPIATSQLLNATELVGHGVLLKKLYCKVSRTRVGNIGRDHRLLCGGAQSPLRGDCGAEGWTDEGRRLPPMTSGTAHDERFTSDVAKCGPGAFYRRRRPQVCPLGKQTIRSGHKRNYVTPRFQLLTT
jgi:hypothetical protein